uniref:Uncharacterized protein n=1 Tax=Arundo donax TaxID=35708 RepID=A0A0A8XWZ2_ARUDO
MRKGAAVGAGPAPERWHASDPLLTGPSLPRRVVSHRLGGPWATAGATAAARVTAARVGLGTVGRGPRRLLVGGLVGQRGI